MAGVRPALALPIQKLAKQPLLFSSVVGCDTASFFSDQPRIDRLNGLHHVVPRRPRGSTVKPLLRWW
jgi:hypothetical protein